MAETTTFGDTASMASFPAAPDSLREARHFVGRTLRAWGFDPMQVVQPAVLLANELVTNAVVHAGAGFDLTVRAGRDRVRIEVRDPSATPPQLVPWEDIVEQGRGLHLVDALALAWGTEPVPGDGKIVWCELPRGG